MKTPDILMPASRQSRHNNGDDFTLIFGFDEEETIKIFTLLEAQLAAANNLIIEAEELIKEYVNP